MHVRNIIGVSFLLLSCSLARASVDLGVGISSVTEGRSIPSLSGGISGGNWAASGLSTGVKSHYYYQSSYALSYFRTWKSGELFWGPVESGFGLGLFYSERAFQDESSTNETKKSDVGGGPAFRVRWLVAEPLYLNMEMIWGLRALSPLLTLNGQDIIVFSIGVAAF